MTGEQIIIFKDVGVALSAQNRMNCLKVVHVMDDLKQCRMRILSDMKKVAYSDHHQTVTKLGKVWIFGSNCRIILQQDLKIHFAL
jgi:hypothetical protein